MSEYSGRVDPTGALRCSKRRCMVRSHSRESGNPLRTSFEIAICELDPRFRGNDVTFDGEARNPPLLRCGLELMDKKESDRDSSLP
jgi:hypothetical protein